MSSTYEYRAGTAAGHEETAKAATEVLDAGGNAFDATIAGFLAACVAEPVLASLGGGGFLVAHRKGEDIRAFDFFTQTPLQKTTSDDVEFSAITADFGTAQQEFYIGLGSVATPGAVAGIFDIHEKLGRLPMTDIVRPAIRLASDGVPINAFQAYLLTVVEPIYIATSESRAMYCSGTGDPGSLPEIKSEGEHIRAPDFADFLQALASEGPDLFYKGEIAAKIRNLSGCTINNRDLAEYRAEERMPLAANINNHQVSINPPPAIGGALISLALRMLDRFDEDFGEFGESEHLHRLVNVLDACNRARIESGIDFDPIAGAEAIEDIKDHPPAYRGTTHISVADRDGNVAAMTVSNGEGCGHIIPGTGIMLNNMLGEEDLNAAGFFNWPTGVRMSSMMSPGIMKTAAGDYIGFGSGGSNRIRSAITQFVANMAVFGMGVSDAVSAPRLHLENSNLDIEPGFSERGLNALKSEHQNTKLWPQQNMFFGGVHAIQVSPSGLVSGAADQRRGGSFIGV